MVWTYRLRRYRVEAGRLIKIGLALAAALTSYGLLPGFALPGQIASAALSVAIFALSLWLLRFPTGGELQIAGAAIQSLRRYNRA